MRIAYLECFSGISGDMFLGALVDAGVPPRVLEEAVEALGVGARLKISRVIRSGVSAAKVDVWADGEWQEHAHSHEQSGDAQHLHEHDGHSHFIPGKSSRTGVSARHEHSHAHGR